MESIQPILVQCCEYIQFLHAILRYRYAHVIVYLQSWFLVDMFSEL